MRDGKWPAKTKCAGGQLESRGGLFPLVFVAVYEQSDVPHQLQVIPALAGNFFRRFHFLDVGLEDAIKNFVGRQRIGVFLIGAEFGTSLSRVFHSCTPVAAS